MISYLKWKIIELDFLSLTILTNSWVGYNVWINDRIYTFVSMNTEVELYIYHHITEGNQSLFGFVEISDKKVFKELIKIWGIGWKVGMQILSLGIKRLVNAVAMKDNKTIESIKWIWKKMAEKIILELKDKDFDIVITKDWWKELWKNLSSSLYNSIKTTLTNMWYNSRDIDRVLLDLPEWMDDVGKALPYVIKKLS